MRAERFILPFLLLSHAAFAQTFTVQLQDLVNLRDFALSATGSDVIFAAARQPNGQADTSTNVYRAQLSSGIPAISRLTDYKNGENLFGGVTSVAYPGTGTRFAYTYTRATGSDEEEVHVLDYSSGSDRTLVVDRDGCIKILCIECLTTCLRSLHMTADAGTVLYEAARNQPFYTIPSAGGTATRLSIFEGSLAASGQRVISQTGKIVFTSAAPFGPTLGFAAQPVDVYTSNLNGSGIQQVTHLNDLNLRASDAVMSADGIWIAFQLTTQSGISAGTQVWAVRADGTGLRQLSDGGTNATTASISEDGSVVTFVQDSQVKQIPTAVPPFGLPVRAVEITKLTLSAPSRAVLSGDGKTAAFLLGPRGGLPAAIYLSPLGASRGFSQFTRVFAPRFLFPSGLVSAAGYAAPSVGSLMTAYGANLGNEELTVASAFPLPTSMGGFELLADLIPIPLQAVTPWQINAQLAQSRLPGTASFQVRTADGLSPDARVKVVATAPEAITMPSTGSGNLLAAAVYPGTKTLADASHQATANDVLEIYALGLGATTPVIEAGVVSPSSPPAEAKIKPRLQIGGIDASISFAGLVPGLAGVYQVNAKVPSGLTAGYKLLEWVAADGSKTGTSGIYIK
ncbi:MAG: hypothetical protein ABI811_17030 [Acidobacteriota bacterium]